VRASKVNNSMKRNRGQRSPKIWEIIRYYMGSNLKYDLVVSSVNMPRAMSSFPLSKRWAQSLVVRHLDSM